MQYEYKTKGVCSQRIFFDIEDGKVFNVEENSLGANALGLVIVLHSKIFPFKNISYIVRSTI